MEECGTLKGGLILEDILFPQNVPNHYLHVFHLNLVKTKELIWHIF